MTDEETIAIKIAKHIFFQKSAMVFPCRTHDRFYKVVLENAIISSNSIWSEAESGSGKSPAIRFICEKIKAMSPNTLVAFVSASRDSDNNKIAFLSRLAKASGITTTSDKPKRVEDLVTQRLIEACIASELRKVIVIIDEAQAMKMIDYNALKNISNETEKLGGSVVTISLGEEPEFGRVVDSIKADNAKRGLAKRFLQVEFQFPLYESLDDIKSLCDAIDSMPVPELQGATVTQNLLPQSFAAGLRLAHHADSIWAALHKRKSKGFEVVETVRNGFLSMLADDAPNYKPTTELFVRAAHNAGVRR